MICSGDKGQRCSEKELPHNPSSICSAGRRHSAHEGRRGKCDNSNEKREKRRRNRMRRWRKCGESYLYFVRLQQTFPRPPAGKQAQCSLALYSSFLLLAL